MSRAANGPEPVLSVTNLVARRAGREVARAGEISVRSGEVLAVVGPNGAGKSTLLQALSWLIPADFDEYRFAGEAISPGRRPEDREALAARRRMAVVFQEPLLLRGTVLENASMGLKLRGKNSGQAEADARGWLERLGVAHLEARPARQLSHGEAQRVSLARALVLRPEALFLDEPFAALDSVTRMNLMRDLKPLLKTSGAAVVFVTHDFSEVVLLADRVAAMEGGRMYPPSTPAEIYASPPSPKLAGILEAARVSAAALLAHFGQN